MGWAAEGRGNRNPKVVVADASDRRKAGRHVDKDGLAWGRQPLVIYAKAGDTIRLDASRSSDPDGDGLTFSWWQQPEIGTTKVTIDQPDQPITTIHLPATRPAEKCDSIHIVCEVHDDGPFHLVAYRRIIIVETEELK